MISEVQEVAILTERLTTGDLTLKLYSNNVVPAKGDTAASYTEVTGGGYLAKTLDKDNWIIVAGSPTTATYVAQDFEFTGVTGGPGVTYGYFIVDASNMLRGQERFPESVLPFTPGNGKLIRITPKWLVN